MNRVEREVDGVTWKHRFLARPDPLGCVALALLLGGVLAEVPLGLGGTLCVLIAGAAPAFITLYDDLAGENLVPRRQLTRAFLYRAVSIVAGVGVGMTLAIPHAAAARVAARLAELLAG